MAICQLINDLVGKQCIIRSSSFLVFTGKTGYHLNNRTDDEWIKICYTEKKIGR